MKLQIPGLDAAQNKIVVRATAAVATLFVLGAAAPLLKPITQGLIGAAPLPMNQEIVQLEGAQLLYNCDTDKVAIGEKPSHKALLHQLNNLDWKTPNQFVNSDEAKGFATVTRFAIDHLQTKCAG